MADTFKLGHAVENGLICPHRFMGSTSLSSWGSRQYPDIKGDVLISGVVLYTTLVGALARRIS